jgi:hypothetical protein
MKTKLMMVGITCVALAACSSDPEAQNGTDPPVNPGGDGGAIPDGGDPNAIPPRPTLGAQIDRQGRPAANTALNHAFSDDAAATGSAKDAYNAAKPDQWKAFIPEIAKNLAIFDALDGVCGNQLLAGPDPVAGRYDTLATVLADDRLFVNLGSTTCSQYLAVEANFLGIENDDCGGRTPAMDVIDITYSVVATGMLSGVGDGVAGDGDGAIHRDSFPFLGLK